MTVAHQYVRPNATRIAAKVMDGEAVIIDLITGTYFSLTDAGGRIWQLVESGLSLAAIADVIAAEYGVERDLAGRDLDALVARLLEEQIVEQIVVSADDAVDPSAVDAVAATAPPAGYHTPELQIYRDMQDLLALDPPMPGLQDIPWK